MFLKNYLLLVHRIHQVLKPLIVILMILKKDKESCFFSNRDIKFLQPSNKPNEAKTRNGAALPTY